MNKQVISFLSLFSLVLILSIYYVLVPASSYKLENVDNQISENYQINDASNLFFTSLEENRKTRHEEFKNAQIDILASNEYSNEEKLVAHELLTQEELVEKTEIGLEQSLNELEFNDIFVEKLDSFFYITAYDKTMSNEDDILKVINVTDIYHDYFKNHENELFNNIKPIVNFVSF